MMVFFVLQWNCHGLRTHIAELRNFLASAYELPHAICLQETHLLDSFQFQIKGYHKPEHLNIRDSKSAEGVAIYIRKDFTYIPNPVPPNISCLSVKIHYGHSYLNLTNFYQPDIQKEAIKKTEILFKDLDNHIVCGDFNAHSPLWGHMGDKAAKKELGALLEEYLVEYNYICLNDGSPTWFGRGDLPPTPLDLTFVSANLALDMDWLVHDDLWSSDHAPVFTYYQYNQHSSNTTPSSRPSQVNRYNIYSKHWPNFTITLNEKLKHFDFEDDTLTNYEEFVQGVQTAALAYSKLPPDSQDTNPITFKHKLLPWWTQECTDAVSEKRKAFNTFRRLKTVSHYLHYKKLKGTTQALLKKTKKESWRNLCKTFNEKTKLTHAWRVLKAMDGRSKSKDPIPTLEQNGIKYATNQEKANLLAGSFAQVSSSNNYSPEFKEFKTYFQALPTAPSHKDFVNPSKTPNINDPFSLAELQRAMASAKNTTPGQDGITMKMLKVLDYMSLNKLLDIYNDIWSSGELPPSWKHSIVVPIPKPGKDPDQAGSYRPISLTSVMCKLFERIVTSRLTWFIEVNKLFDMHQSGFRTGRCTSDNIARLYNDAQYQINNQGITKAILLDISKAFDMVWHDGLLYKLHKLGVDGSMFAFIKSFLSNRTFQVMLQDSLSDVEELENGTPQGSVISPVLFIIMINDLPFDQIVNTRLKTNLYALERWCIQWGFNISPQKTQGIILSRKVKFLEEPLYINTIPIKFTRTVKYLGIIFDTRFTFGPHLETVIDKCNKRINLLRCLTGTSWGAGKESLLLLYRGLIRSLMEYCSFIYHNVSNTQFKKLEIIQNKAMRVICGAHKSTPGSVLVHTRFGSSG
jgi:hypothetical protein